MKQVLGLSQVRRAIFSDQSARKCLKTGASQEKTTFAWFAGEQGMQLQAQSSGSFHYCRFEKLLELPALPEMVFGDNKLTLRHCDGYGIRFETLEALKLVNNHCDLLKVADAEEWAKTR